jgi:hypothetical protein
VKIQRVPLLSDICMKAGYFASGMGLELRDGLPGFLFDGCAANAVQQ